MFQIIFGIKIYVPKDILYNSMEAYERIYVNFYNDLIVGKHASTTSDKDGNLHLVLDNYAQNFLASQATDYASENKNNPKQVLDQINGSATYKLEFKRLFLNYINYYIPGTTVQITNTQQSDASPVVWDY